MEANKFLFSTFSAAFSSLTLLEGSTWKNLVDVGAKYPIVELEVEIIYY